ncbi:uncharacterized protein LOC103573766 isoform X2 [Microplitis demolitor]|uniref:uncharacterized protein LOC103573766 isoform X2 n=1 Tax=Microplitis demolitor TaxID=69319 RepID=UPI0004CCD1DD|nr:uncharacterized protein LOC103573766 isoform X2 [Microplitis demolitor]XP_053592868.1 uncharacterized protein LOC103573766 isoform X2 [Microplitis demolitor]
MEINGANITPDLSEDSGKDMYSASQEKYMKMHGFRGNLSQFDKQGSLPHGVTEFRRSSCAEKILEKITSETLERINIELEVHMNINRESVYRTWEYARSDEPSKRASRNKEK